MILEKIKQANDIKKIKPENYDLLAEEIREYLVRHVAKTGGHLSSNLACVELTMALHLALDLPKDKIVWDVGHQSYTHKILTGRKEQFDTLRQFHGLSGFPKREESPCDAFNTGHSSTSISLGIGMVEARDRQKEDYTVVSVIGDGALTGGMAYEAMNNAARLQSNFIIILNDNNMSISESTGGLSQYLSHIRLDKGYNNLKADVTNRLASMPYIGDTLVSTISRAKSSLKQLIVPGMLFENLGLTYLGPVDGHDIHAMVDTIREAKKAARPILIHVRTRKGKGYAPAEKHPDLFHGVGPFDVETGKPLKKKTRPTYSDVFSGAICELAASNDKICAVTAAMSDGTGLKWFSKLYPDRFFDVGIAEEHAVTMAAGMASAGLKPVVAVYSTFLQRAYDSILHDVCMNSLPVVFAVDRAGLVGDDGSTHQGIFDLSYLGNIPGMTLIAPKDGEELKEALAYAVAANRPVAIRYPRGEVSAAFEEFPAEAFQTGKSQTLVKGEDPITLIAVGSMAEEAFKAARLLQEAGLSPTVVNARFVKPFDRELLSDLAKKEGLVAFLEDNTISGGFGEACARYLWEQRAVCRPLFFGIQDRYVEQGTIPELRKMLGLDAASIAARVKEEWEKK